MKKVLFLGIAMLMFVLTACNKESEQNIIGSWKLVLTQISAESSYGYNENYNNAVEEDIYFIFQKNGVFYHCDEDGMSDSGKWAYVDGKIVIGEDTYDIENFSHKEMDLVYTEYYEDYYGDDEYDWQRTTYRMHFKREKAPKEYRNK